MAKDGFTRLFQGGVCKIWAKGQTDHLIVPTRLARRRPYPHRITIHNMISSFQLSFINIIPIISSDRKQEYVIRNL